MERFEAAKLDLSNFSALGKNALAARLASSCVIKRDPYLGSGKKNASSVNSALGAESQNEGKHILLADGKKRDCFHMSSTVAILASYPCIQHRILIERRENVKLSRQAVLGR